MNEKELFGKQKNNNPDIKKDANGDILVHIGNRIWIRQKDIPSKKEVREEFSRYRHPTIYKSEIILNILTPILMIASFVAISSIFIKNKNFIFFLYEYLIILGLYLFLRLKSIVIFFIQIYQILTPMTIRCRCCLTPTCSEYAILAIKKYGLIIGIIKAIKRLKRCNGQPGKDYP